MASNIKTVSFQAPSNPIDPAAQQLQAEMLQRNQAIADALRQQSMEDIQVPAGSRISWTQGLAKALQAWSANRMTRNNMAAQWDMAQQSTNANRALSGLGAMPDSPNPFSTSEKGRTFGQRIGDALRGGPPVNQQAISAHQAAMADALSRVGQPDPAATDRQPSGTAAIGSNTPMDKISNVPVPKISGPAPAPGGSDSNTMPNGQPSTTAPQMANPVYGSGGVDDPGGQSPTIPAPLTPIAVPPSSSPQQGSAYPQGQAPSSAMGAPQPTGQPTPQPNEPMSPNIPGMTAAEDYRLRMTQPDVYKATVQSYLQPTDLQRNLLAEGLRPGTPEWNNAIAAQVRHDGTLQQRPGGTDRYGNEFTYNPVLPQGVTPNRDAQGDVTGVSPIPGVTQALTDQAAANAAGPAKYDLTQTYNQRTRQNEFHSRYDVANSPTPFAAGPPLGAGAGADHAATLSQEAYDADAKAGQTIPIAQQTISKLQDLAKVTLTGPGAGRMGEIKGAINYASQSAGGKPIFDPGNVARLQEIGKLAEQMAQQTAGMMGGASGATDAKLASAIRSLPNPDKAPQAMKDILDLSADRLAAGKAYTLASAANQARGLPANQFKANWISNYDPRIFEWMREGTVAQHMQALQKAAPAEYRTLATKSQALADMGAFGQ